jgi:hypothetical protein
MQKQGQIPVSQPEMVFSNLLYYNKLKIPCCSPDGFLLCKYFFIKGFTNPWGGFSI